MLSLGVEIISFNITQQSAYQFFLLYFFVCRIIVNEDIA